MVITKHNWAILSNFSGIIRKPEILKGLKLHNLKNVYFLSLLSLLREKVHYRKLIAPIVQMSSGHEDANQKVSISRNPFFLFIVGSVKFMSKTEIIGPERTLTISWPKLKRIILRLTLKQQLACEKVLNCRF